MKNLYYQLLVEILGTGIDAESKKGKHKFLLNKILSLNEENLFRIFNEHPIAKTKLKNELELYIGGITDINIYNEKNIFWWDYCKPILINSYPDYFSDLNLLINTINKEKKYSRNYILIVGNNKFTNQKPCLNLLQFQVVSNNLFITSYIRSSDANLGLPSDIWQIFLISEKIDISLANITVFIGNVHIYENNIENTYKLLAGHKVNFNLNI
jgi:thymidylate synthase